MHKTREIIERIIQNMNIIGYSIEKVFAKAQILRPDTPIIFVESLLSKRACFDEKMRKNIEDANNTLRTEFKAMQEKGIPGIYFIEMQGATGTDHFAEQPFYMSQRSMNQEYPAH